MPSRRRLAAIGRYGASTFREPEVTFRPSRSAYRRFVMARLPVFAVLLAFGVLRVVLELRGGGRLWQLVALVLIVAAAIAYVVAYLRRAAVILTPDRFVTVGALRRRRTPRIEIGSWVSAGTCARERGGR